MNQDCPDPDCECHEILRSLDECLAGGCSHGWPHTAEGTTLADDVMAGRVPDPAITFEVAFLTITVEKPDRLIEQDLERLRDRWDGDPNH